MARLGAETSRHGSTKKVQRANPGIFKDPSGLRNLDKTSVGFQYGLISEVFGSSRTNHGGYVSCQARKTNKHMTPVVEFSASGLKFPPFSIVEGRNVMIGWISPLKRTEIISSSLETSRLPQKSDMRREL